ncbi:molybdate ABC transporter substrate-binding protein [Ancylobacter vacuolatus]|uniref:Molybdate transport system substrate-binding protein n=1 Tax=Ancylobacter vacuolatus TaxID=223389 RepID=A0ABU0DEI5_9HYPH|nr:substrate-binding domain-containing protein [Ancylobacter vacuolatus]MDQ0346832.1 molybdate transport system substrate-binding protein [Ancylobacter vacuolatus]
MAGSSLRLMSTLAVEKAFKSRILPAWRELGREIEVAWSPTTVLMREVEAGARADAIVLIDGPMAELVAAGIVLAESVTPIAQARVGLGMRAGAIPPDISTPDRFRQVLLDAPSIAYSRTGASGIYFARLIAQLGIADEINAKAVVVPAGFTGEKILSGEAEFAVQQVSELMSVDGVEVIGAFPDEVQAPTDFSAAIFREAREPAAAQAFLAHLTSAAAHSAYSEGGLIARFDRPVG